MGMLSVWTQLAARVGACYCGLVPRGEWQFLVLGAVVESTGNIH